MCVYRLLTGLFKNVNMYHIPINPGKKNSFWYSLVRIICTSTQPFSLTSDCNSASLATLQSKPSIRPVDADTQSAPRLTDSSCFRPDFNRGRSTNVPKNRVIGAISTICSADIQICHAGQLAVSCRKGGAYHESR